MALSEFLMQLEKLMQKGRQVYAPDNNYNKTCLGIKFIKGTSESVAKLEFKIRRD